jgi:hypothetical protein
VLAVCQETKPNELRNAAVLLYSADELHRWSSRVSAQTEAHCQHATPQDASRRNFIPQRDVARYCGTRDYSCNGTTVCRTLCWANSHHWVERGVAFGSECG